MSRVLHFSLTLSLLLSSVPQSSADVLAVTHADFSNASAVNNTWPPDVPNNIGLGANGFYYGYYGGVDNTDGAFTTGTSGAGLMQPGMDGPRPIWWADVGGTNAPSIVSYMQHTGSAGQPAVRRYVVGSAGEPTYTGTVRVVGRYYDLNGGSTKVLVAVDPDGDAGGLAREFRLPHTELFGPTPVAFDFTTSVSPGTTIDFAVFPNGAYNSDATGAVAWIVTEDVPVPTNVVATNYNSPQFSTGSGAQDTRGLIFALVTDGVIGGADLETFDTSPASQYAYAGLLYQENAGSGKVTKFNTVWIDVTTGGDFAELPHIFLLRHNSDPGSINPAQDERYVQLPVTAVRTAANAAGQPYYTFDLTSLPENLRTGYGFAVFGRGTTGAIAVSEISADAERVSDVGYVPVSPVWVERGGHRYGLTLTRGTWEQTEAEASEYGGHLASLNSQLENDWVFDAFGRGSNTYIGLRQNPLQTNVEPRGGWTWMDGTVLNMVNGDPLPGVYENWNDAEYGGSEPNQAYGAGEDYATFAPSVFGGSSRWGDIKNAGFPETSNYRGIVELDSVAGPEVERNYQVTVSGQANIFGAGQANSTPSVEAGTGGVAAPFRAVYGGEKVRITASNGSVFTGAETSGVDGTHHSTKRCDITGVGGVSGYLNFNNSAHLVGVFVADTPQATTPARIDFSAGATGEGFSTLSPGLGQVFFIGDGFTPGGKAQEFVAPAGATRLYLGMPDAYQGDNNYVYTGPPNGYADNSGAWFVRLAVTPSLTPQINASVFPGAGGELTVVGGTGPYSWSVLYGALPPHLSLGTVYPTNGSVEVVANGVQRANGVYAFTIQVQDGNGATSTQAYEVTIADPVPPKSGLVAWWPAEYGVNEVMSGRHGSLKNGADFGAGKVGTGFVLDGINDYVEVADHDSLDLADGMTIEAWVSSTVASGERTIVSKRNGDNNEVNYVLFTREGVLHFAWRTAGGTFNDVSSGTVLPAGLSHVAVTSGNALKFYVNGVEVATGVTGTRAATSGPLTIGATVTDNSPSNAPDGPWAGVIDELSLYSRGLSEAEIQAVYLAGVSGKLRSDAAKAFSLNTNPIGEWSFCEVPGPTWATGYVPGNATLLTGAQAGTQGGKVDRWYGGGEISKNTSTVVAEEYVGGGNNRYWQPGELACTPGGPAAQRWVVLRWTAPAAGRYVVSANFRGAEAGYTGPTYAGVHVWHNTDVLYDGFLNTYRGDGLSHTVMRTVAAGDRVDFFVDSGYSTRNTAITASVVALGSLPQIEQQQFPEDTRPYNIPWRLTATGGTGPYTFAVVGGALPPGIALAGNGDLSGEATAIGHFQFTVRVTDAEGQTAQRNFAVAFAEETGVPAGITSWFPGELHVHDVAGGKLGSLVNSTENAFFGEGKNSVGFVFDGVDDAVEVNGSGVLNQLPLTIETWIKPEMRSGSATDFWPTNIVSGDRAYYGGHGIGANVFADGSQLIIEVQHTNTAAAFRRVSGDFFQSGVWAHVALVLTPGNAMTYVNGVLVDDFDFEQGDMDADPYFRIGRHNEDAGYPVGRRFFKGVIDELSTYNRALSGVEISGIYNADALGKTRDDAARDFYSFSNEAGQIWQYGKMGTGLAPEPTTFQLYPTVGSDNALRYWREGSAIEPNVTKNRGGVTYLLWEARQLSMHPGTGPERIYSAARWTAAESGTYAFFMQGTRLNSHSGVSTLHFGYTGTGSIGNGPKVILQSQPRDVIFGTKFINAGETVDFVVGSYDDFNHDTVGVTPSVVLVQAAPTPTPVTNLKIQTESPAITHAKWYFTATRTPDEATVTMTLEYSATPEVESSWTPVSGFLTSSRLVNTPVGSDVWTCDPTLILPEGSYYFRVVTEAAGYRRQVSDAYGNEALTGGSGLGGPIQVGPVPAAPVVTNLQIVTAKPIAAGKQWVFNVNHPNTLGLRLLVQYSLTPEDPNSWQFLPGSADLGRPNPTGKGSTTWSLKVSRLSIPGGNVSFRIVSQTFGSPDSYSEVFGAESLAGAKAGTTGPIVVKNPALLTVATEAQLKTDTGFAPIENSLVHEGELIAYKIRYRNHGEATAGNVTLTVNWASQFEAVSATGTTTPIYKKANNPSSGIVGVKIAVGDVVASPNFSTQVVILRVKSGVKTPGRGAINLLGTVLAESPDSPDVRADLPFLALVDPLSVELHATEFYYSKGSDIPLGFSVTNKTTVDVTNVKAVLKIPAGVILDFDSIVRDPQTELFRKEDKGGNTTELTVGFGTIPAGQARAIIFTWTVPFDSELKQIVTGNPAKGDPGYTATANQVIAGKTKTLVAVGDGLFVGLTDAIVRPPQIDLTKDVEGELLDGRRTHGVWRKVVGDEADRLKKDGKDPVELVRGALVAPGGVATFNVMYRNMGEGVAKNLVIQDYIPAGCTLVPGSVRLNDQVVALGGNLKGFTIVASKQTPVGPNETITDEARIKFFKVYAGNTEAGQGGVLTYRVVASTYSASTKKYTPLAPGVDATVGGRTFGTPIQVSQPLGFLDNLEAGAIGSPDYLALLVVKPRDLRLTVLNPLGKVAVGGQARFGLRYENAGSLPAYNCFVDLPIPVGTKGHSVVYVNNGTANPRSPQSGEEVPGGFAGATGTQRIQLGTLLGGETREVAVRLSVDSPLHPNLAEVDSLQILPKLNGYDSAAASGAQARSLNGPPAPKLAGALKVPDQPMVLLLAKPRGAKPWIGRIVPVGAVKNGTMEFTILFGNSGDKAATAGNVAMQIPYDTTFLEASAVQMTQPADLLNPNNLNDTKTTINTRTEKKGARIERIVVDLPRLEPHSTGCFTFKVKIASNFGAAAVEDSSCRIKMSRLPEVAAIPCATQVRSENGVLAIFESVWATFTGMGSWISRGFKSTVQEQFKNLTVNSQFYSTAGLDVFTVKNGAIFAPLGFNRALVLGPSRLVAAGGGNLVAAGGLNMVAAGGGNLVGVNGVPEEGNLKATQLMARIPSLVAAGAGNLVAAGGGNLVGMDHATLIGQDGGSLIGQDGGSLIGQDGGSFAKLNGAELVGMDGGTLATISSNGSSYNFQLTAVGAALVAAGGGNLVAAGAGNLVAAGGGNLVAAGGGNLVAAGGGNLVAAGGGNLVAAGAGN